MKFPPAPTRRAWAAFALLLALLVALGIGRSWPLALSVFNVCLISALFSLSVNIQWGYAGLFNVGVMGFAALGGLAVLLISHPPVMAAWAAGGGGLLRSLAALIVGVGVAVIWRRRCRKWTKLVPALAIVWAGLAAAYFYLPAKAAIEAVDPSKTGFLGGLGLPVLLSWVAGGILAAAAAWLVGKITLNLRADYLAIATLGISEIIIAILKHEDWLTRGVKNVTGLPRPVPREIDLQQSDNFAAFADWLYGSPATEAAVRMANIEASGLVVKLSYTALFMTVLLAVLLLCVLALNSPWGRMMRAIRDDETAAAALGKNVQKRRLQVFVLGSAVAGIAGAMLTTLDGQFTPGTYHPLRHTFLIWVMVIVGGSGNNLGAVLGGALVWLMWVEAEPLGVALMNTLTAWMAADNPLRLHLLTSAQHMRLFLMGVMLLLIMRFAPAGILPERVRSG